LQGDGRRGIVVAAGLCLGLATWTRPEGIAWTALVGAMAFWLRRRRDESTHRVLVATGIAVAFWLALLAFRLAVFGRFHPNTYYAKMGGDPLLRALGGLGYVRHWLVAGHGCILLLFAAGGLLFQPTPRRGAAAVALLAGLGHLLLVIYEGGDWIPHFRFIAPALGVLAGMASFGFVVAVARLAGRRAWSISILATLVLCAGAYVDSRADMRRALAEVQTRVFGWGDAHQPLGKWLGLWRALRGGELRVAIFDIGLVGWYSGAQIDDLAGLTDPQWARLAYESRNAARYPSRALVLEKRPEAIVLVTTEALPPPHVTITWYPDSHVFADSEFKKRYRLRVVFRHKHFPGDCYHLCVFLRNDVFDEPPPVAPPPPRASGGWDKVDWEARTGEKRPPPPRGARW
jgi:hypothetical protein